MVALIYTGTGVYRGFDPALGRMIEAASGQRVTVSPEKAKQLLHDFPGQWKPAEPCRDRAHRPRRRRLRQPERNK
ncbi:MAG: hypothetical protein H5T86_10390 [Armatimonadetes bacterium]|nr:hypothetical protein [Armatimonadota bacterium]